MDINALPLRLWRSLSPVTFSRTTAAMVRVFGLVGETYDFPVYPSPRRLLQPFSGPKRNGELVSGHWAASI